MKSLVFRKLSLTFNLSRIISIAVGTVFAYAGISKAVDVNGFAESIMAYQITGPYLSKILASTLPYIEILAGGLLLAGYKAKESLIIITGLCVIFTAAICYAMTVDLQISCGCFSGSAQPGNLILSIARNIGIIGACTYCLTRKERLYGLA